MYKTKKVVRNMIKNKEQTTKKNERVGGGVSLQTIK